MKTTDLSQTALPPRQQCPLQHRAGLAAAQAGSWLPSELHGHHQGRDDCGCGFQPRGSASLGGLSLSQRASLGLAGPAVPWAAVWQGREGGAAGKPGAPLWQK